MSQSLSKTQTVNKDFYFSLETCIGFLHSPDVIVAIDIDILFEEDECTVTVDELRHSLKRIFQNTTLLTWDLNYILEYIGFEEQDFLRINCRHIDVCDFFRDNTGQAVPLADAVRICLSPKHLHEWTDCDCNCDLGWRRCMRTNKAIVALFNYVQSCNCRHTIGIKEIEMKACSHITGDTIKKGVKAIAALKTMAYITDK